MMLFRNHTPVNDMQFKTIKWKKNPRFLYRYIICLYPDNFTGTKSWKGDSNQECLHLFLVQKYSKHLAQFFNIIIQGTFMSLAMQNPHFLFLVVY